MTALASLVPETGLNSSKLAVEQQAPGMHVTWQGYDVAVRKLAAKIKESAWEFDTVLCIARGGMFVGDALSRIFKKPLAVIFASSRREEGGTKQGELLISERIAMVADTLGKKVLLVDDLADSGLTLLKIKEAVKRRYPKTEEIRTAVLWVKTCSEFQPDYHAEMVEANVWIHQPFEVYDENPL